MGQWSRDDARRGEVCVSDRSRGHKGFVTIGRGLATIQWVEPEFVRIRTPSVFPLKVLLDNAEFEDAISVLPV